MIRCNFSSSCGQSWLSMTETDESTVRICPQCQQSVYWVESYHEFKHAAQRSLCIAFEPTSVLLEAETDDLNHGVPKQFLLLEKQKLSMKQLNHVKQFVCPERSLKDLRNAYHNKKSVIKYESRRQDVEEVADILRNVGMKIDVKREEHA